ADITFSQILANHDRVVDAIQPGTETTTYSVSGTNAAGRAFDIDFGDRYTSTFDIAFEGVFEIADVVYVLSRMKGVTIDDITATADVIDDTAAYRLRGVEQKRGGQWAPIGRRQPAVITPGKVLRLRATVTGNGVTRVVPLSVDVPVDAKRRGYLEITGGASSWDDGVYRAKTPGQVEAAIEGMVRNDEVVANLYFFQRGKDKTSRGVSRAQDLVVRGRAFAEVTVRR
ncbi:MAG: hypothetical protein ACXWDL_09760, partial [Nocardioides sp.]